MTKLLVANGKISGFTRELAAIKEQRNAATHKQTMGQLVKQYLENTHTEGSTDDDIPDSLDDMYLSFFIRLDVDKSFYESRKEAMATLVSERNELIHHLLLSFDPTSIQSCREIDQQLDTQREKITSEIDLLRSLIETLQKGKNKLAEVLASDEAFHQLELDGLRQSWPVILLGKIAAQAARPDGWTSLTTAGQLVGQHAPKEIAALKKEYGCKTFKELMLATELFDIYEEPTNRGGVRVLYRLKEGWRLGQSKTGDNAHARPTL